MFLKPTPPPYDPLEWQRLPLADKSRQVCAAWAMQGYGTPLFIYGVYILKIALFVGAWLWFCGRSPDLGPASNVAAWWSRPEAFEKAILWGMLFELLGFGCGSGPLTGRYLPPFGGALYFLRPGTTKLPLVRLAGGSRLFGARRTIVDVALYAAIVVSLGSELVAPHPDRSRVGGIVLLLVVAGLLDKTIFLCARAEHYATTLAIVALSKDFIPGAMAVQAALWFWAGFSKLNHHFPAAVGIMTSNNPLMPWAWVRRLMYTRYPSDLSPSRLATTFAHGGTLLEFAVPLVLLFAGGVTPTGRVGMGTVAGLCLMVFLHGYIMSNVPMGVPLEWNVMMMYGGFFLFGAHASESVTTMTPLVAILVGVMCVAVPLAGNVWPSRVSFLLAMRYYSGNWPMSVWLFRGTSYDKLDRLTKSSPWIYRQLGRMYDEKTSIGLVGKVVGFRLMHLHGRALCELVPKALPRDSIASDYEWVDGEVVAGLALGWNFGDGHLHDERLLSAIQEQCGFDEGELRCVMIESQPLGRPTMRYRLHDAKTGLFEEGHVQVDDLRRRQPWEFSSSPAQAAPAKAPAL